MISEATYSLPGRRSSAAGAADCSSAPLCRRRKPGPCVHTQGQACPVVTQRLDSPALGGRLHDLSLIAEPLVREFAPAFRVSWGYNVPDAGPTIEAGRGDRLRSTFGTASEPQPYTGTADPAQRRTVSFA